MLAATFIETGLSTLRRPGPQTDQVRPLVAQAAGPLRLPAEPEVFLRVDGAVMVTAGMFLAFGRIPRLAALALAASATPAVYGEIAHWRDKDPEQRRARRSELLTRLGLIGGALLAAVDTAGRPGLIWRSRHVGRQARRAGRIAARRARQANEQTQQRAVAARRKTQRAVERTRRQAAAAARRNDARE